MPVALLAIYLQKGDYITFHDRYEVEFGNIKTQFRFTTVKLWEHKSRVRSVELIELAPLMILFEETPTQQIVKEEIALIKNSALSDKVQSELLSVALILASRLFTRDAINFLFEEDVKMIYEKGLVDDWLEEREAKGELKNMREMLLKFLTRRFSALPNELVAKINESELEWCESLFDQSITVNSLPELHWEN